MPVSAMAFGGEDNKTVAVAARPQRCSLMNKGLGVDIVAHEMRFVEGTHVVIFAEKVIIVLNLQNRRYQCG